ncbi:MAG TPA: hypothetical protein EYP62_05450 [Kiritimatiellae bacterium]|nr:hypothetical protein [Kiritimatiellia bacterium]
MVVVNVIIGACAGTLASTLLSVLPGLHVYNVIGLLVMLQLTLASHGLTVGPEVYLPFMTGMIVGWSLLNTIPAVLLGAPDESALFTVLPGQKYLMFGRGYEGTMITGVGGLGAVILLVCVVGPLAPRLLPPVQEVMRPHMHWILWIIITYILMSEWPKGGNWGPAGWRKFMDAWRSLGAGLLTFLLAALLGFILLYRSPVSSAVAFQNIMPAFVGLFAVPWCLVNMLSGTRIPRQHLTESLDILPEHVLRGVGAGGLGGGLAAFFPVVTGGVGGLLAGHATAQRDERVFLLSQGVSKLVYYSGAFLLLFVPGLGITRGGGAWMVRTLHTAGTYGDYFMVLAAMALSGAIAFLLMDPLTRSVIRLIEKVDYRVASAVALAIISALVYAVTGWIGLGIAAVATGIGLNPVLFGSRRLNCLGILLLPIACNMSGVGHHVAAILGLVK